MKIKKLGRFTRQYTDATDELYVWEKVWTDARLWHLPKRDTCMDSQYLLGEVCLREPPSRVLSTMIYRS